MVQDIPSGDELTRLLAERLREKRLNAVVVGNFCGVKPATVRSWYAGRTPLGGSFTLRIWHLLEAAGVESPELQQVRQQYPFGELLGRLWAYKVITTEQAKQIGGDIQKESTLLRGIRMETQFLGPSKSLEDLQFMFGGALEVAERKLRKSLSEAIPEPITVPRPPLIPHQEPARSYPIQVLMVQAAAALKSAIPIMQVLVSDSCNDQERAMFRELVGASDMFEAGNLITELSSRRAHRSGRESRD